MSIPITPVTVAESGFGKLSNNIMDKVAELETGIRDTIEETTRANSDVVEMPKSMLQFLENIEAKITTSQERATFEAYKEVIYKSHQYNVNYLNERVDAKSKSAGINMALSALQKSSSAIQQILSAS